MWLFVLPAAAIGFAWFGVKRALRAHETDHDDHDDHDDRLTDMTDMGSTADAHGGGRR